MDVALAWLPRTLGPRFLGTADRVPTDTLSQNGMNRAAILNASPKQHWATTTRQYIEPWSSADKMLPSLEKYECSSAGEKIIPMHLQQRVAALTR